MKKFSKGEAIRFGWDIMKSNFWRFVGFLILAWLIPNIPGMVAEAIRENIPILAFILSIVGAAIGIVVQMGLIRFALRFLDNKKGRFSDLFSCFPLFFKYAFGAALYGLIVLGGTILLIIPGIIWAIKFQFFSYFIVDKGLGPVAAIKKSGAITKGAKWNLFLFGILLGLVNLLGLLCLLIGLFATVPTTLVAVAFVYRKLLSVTEETQAPSAPQGFVAPSQPSQGF